MQQLKTARHLLDLHVKAVENVFESFLSTEFKLEPIPGLATRCSGYWFKHAQLHVALTRKFCHRKNCMAHRKLENTHALFSLKSRPS